MSRCATPEDKPPRVGLVIELARCFPMPSPLRGDRRIEVSPEGACAKNRAKCRRKEPCIYPEM
jgi:hypothetical protein